MSLPVKFICKKSKLRKDGTCIIFIQYCHSSDRRILLNTGIAIPPDFWNRKRNTISNNLPPKYGNVDELQQALTGMLRKTEDLISASKKQKNISVTDFLKQNFYNNILPDIPLPKSKDSVFAADIYSQIDLLRTER